MQTTGKEITISGKGLMSGRECSVNLFPSEEKGIRFYLSNSKTPIIACAENVVSTDNCVVLGNSEGLKVVLVEHFMAACAFAGIDSLDVCLSSFELPILDGSAAEWYKILPNAENIEETTFEKPLASNNVMLMPANELKITYCVNFDHPELKNRWVSFDLSQDKTQIIEARTFGYLKDLERFQQAGMALGVTQENTVGLTEDGYTTALRSEFEPVKHKILDLIGDLYLTGMNPLGFKVHIIAYNAGHKAHVEFARLVSQ
ncbi:MAG: hypothetical protein A2Y25_08770 [Candidatus Melainabacteria bacterium GWF2_37_15]|nr:MAG: hypothetical protein A2Y25_08770 [Candidatus Melainabacteria bacterium GWF2_37_15]